MLKNKIIISSDLVHDMEEKLLPREALDDNLSSILERMKLEKITSTLTNKSETEDNPDVRHLER